MRRVAWMVASGASLALSVAACGPRRVLAPSTPAPAPLAAPRVTPGSLQAAPLLGDLPQRVSHLGGGPLAIVVSGPMAEGERLGAFVEVPPDACLLVYGRSSPSLEDIDLAAFADEGNPVAVDEGPDPRPTLLVCPPHPARVYVAAHAASGEGLCVVAAQLVPRELAPEIGRIAGARGVMGGRPPRSPEAWPGLDDQVRNHRATIGGRWEEQRRVAVAADSRAVSSVAFSIEEGGCSDALIVPDDDVAVIDVDVLDGDGRLVARAKDGGPSRSVTICSPIAVNGSLQVRPHVGRGLVAVVASKTKGDTSRELLTRADVAWVAPAQPLDTTREARNSALAKAGYGPPTSTQAGRLQLGRRTTVPVDLPAGSCTRVDVVAGAPLALVEAAVWDDAGALLASADGSGDATLFACGKGKARVDLGTRGRPGPFAVLTRAERWKDAAFAAHPLAAARMLGRAAVAPSWTHEGSAGTVRHAVLDATHQYVHNAAIAPGQCLRVALGAEGDGTGLEVRLVDAVSGEELDRSHGQNAVSVRACASASTRSVRLEARASAGKLDVILGERLSAQR